MNTKGTKFLAVLAVLAMAFATVAVFDVASEFDAIEPAAAADYYAPGSSTLDVKSIAEGTVASLAEGKYVITGDVTITEVAGAATVYVPTGKTLTFTSAASVVTLIPVSVADNKLSELNGIQIKASAATTGTFKVDSASAVTVGGAITVSEATVPAGTELVVVSSITIAGEINNNGTISIKNATADKAQVVLTGAGSITSSSKGVIDSSAVWEDAAVTSHSIVINNGTIENQKIYARGYAGVDHGVICVTGEKTTGVAIQNNEIVLERPNGICVRASSGAFEIKIENNTFTSATYIDQCILVWTSAIGGQVIVKGNNVDGIYGYAWQDASAAGEYNVKFDKMALDILVDDELTATIGAIGNETALIQTDIKSLGMKHLGTLNILDTITLDMLGVKAGGTVTVAAEKTVTINSDLEVAGTLTNSGTIYVPKAADVTKVSGAGSVRVLNSGDVKDIGAETEITDADYQTANVPVIITTGAVTNAVVPAGKALVVESETIGANATLNVAADNSEITLSGVTTAATFTVDFGGSKTVKFTGFEGSATFSKGSIIINGEGITATDIALHNGDVVKIDGDVASVTFTYADSTGSAQILVEAGKSLTLATGLTIDSAKISMDINGNVYNGTITSKGAVNINDGSIIVGTELAVSGDGAYTVFSGSDINGISKDSAWASITGKDAASGTWTFDGINKLTLVNYNGTYNFAAMKTTNLADKITKIAVDGDVSISYALKAAGILFPALERIDSDEGTLTIDVDMSSFPGASLGAVNGVLAAPAGLKINQVDVTINVTGNNAEWTEGQITGANFVAVSVAVSALDLYNTTLTVSVLDTLAYDAGGVKGVAAVGINATSAVMDVTAKGVAVTSTGVFDVKSSDDTWFLSGAMALYVNNDSSILMTKIMAEGDVTITGEVTISNFAYVSVSEELDVVDVTIEKNSSLVVSDLTLRGALNAEKSSEVGVTGIAAIKATGSIANSGYFVNSGTMYVYGTIVNNIDGTFINDGKIIVMGYTVKDGITVGTDDELSWANTATTAGKAKVKSIVLTEIVEVNVDGSAKVKANVTLTPKENTGYEPLADVIQVFEGTITPVQADGSYTLTLTKGTANITVTYNASATDAGAAFNKSYAISVTGSISVPTENSSTHVIADMLYDLEAIPADTSGLTVKLTSIISAVATSKLQVVAGTFTNSDDVSIFAGDYSDTDKAVVKKDAVYNGDLVLGDLAAVVVINGALTGDVTSAGAVTVEADGTLVGNLSAKTATIKGTLKEGEIVATGAVEIEGTVEGDVTTKGTINATAGVTKGTVKGKITTEANVKIKTLTGDVEITTVGGAAAVSVNFMKMTGSIIYNSTYNTDAPTAPAVPTTATVTMNMAVSGEAQVGGAVIYMKSGTNATTTVAGTPGFFYIDPETAAAKENTTLELKLTAGKVGVLSNTTLKAGYALIIESGTTIEIADKNVTLNVTGAALKVSDGATKNFEEGAASPVTYGKVVYVMKYEVSDGYTIYSNVAYALENSDENSTLTVGQSTSVDTPVTIGTGIEVVVPEGITLTFNAKKVAMKEGAKITLEGTGKVIFKPTTQDVSASTYEYFTVSGNIVYEENIIKFDAVRFDADSTIFGVAETSSAPSMLNVTLSMTQGTATLVAGNAIGSVALKQTAYPVTKADADAEPVKNTNFSAALTVAKDTNFEVTTLTDGYGNVDYKAGGAVAKVNTLATKITVDGTLVLSTIVSVKGELTGDGSVILGANKTLTIEAWYAFPEDGDAIAAKNIAPVVNITLIDTTDAKNGYKIEGVKPLGNEVRTVVFTATGANLMTVGGTMDAGTLTALTTAVLDTLIIDKDATVVADDVKFVGAGNSNAIGALKAKAVDEDSIDKLTYDTTYVDGEYTVYTALASIDLTKVSEVTIEKAAFAFNQDLTGDATINIKDGVVATITANIAFGTPITTLGATGIVINGDIRIDAAHYLIVYTDVTINGKILNDDGTEDAKKSVFDIDGTEYASVYSTAANLPLTGVTADMNVSITGYTFTYWTAYATGAKVAATDFIGATDATTVLTAGKVTITIASVEGVTYYLDGVEYLTTDLATKVKVGSVVTMKISDTSKYQGTPKIDGKTNYVVSGDSDGKTITATGVSPVEPPAPEPTGMSLTEILLIVLVVLIAIMVVIIALRLNRS